MPSLEVAEVASEIVSVVKGGKSEVCFFLIRESEEEKSDLMFCIVRYFTCCWLFSYLLEDSSYLFMESDDAVSSSLLFSTFL